MGKLSVAKLYIYSTCINNCECMTGRCCKHVSIFKKCNLTKTRKCDALS